VVANDTFAVLRAGLDTPRGRPWGVAVTCGAGINCQGVAPDGRTSGFLALGSITGDWGGASGLGRAALWWAIRAEDGRGPRTALREVVAGHFGLPTVRDVAVAIHLEKIDVEDLQGLAPALLATAAQGDQVARDLVRRLAGEIVTMAGTVIRRLGLTEDAVPVVLGGGVLTARDPQLTGLIAERLAERAPRAEVSVVAVPPIAGAALLGLDRAGAGPTAERRLRAAYSPPPIAPAALGQPGAPGQPGA
jgi:N-acetylglucosamine kinase-like BadF-type ATPase